MSQVAVINTLKRRVRQQLSNQNSKFMMVLIYLVELRELKLKSLKK